MTRRIYKYLVLSLIATLGLTGFTGCGDDITEVTERYYSGAELETINFEVLNDQWKWNVSTGRYEFAYTFPELDDYMFYDGLIDGSVYVWKTVSGKDYQVLVKCPYVQSYFDEDAGVEFTQTIGFEVYNKPSEKIVFFIQANDLKNGVILDDYKFKINFVYRVDN